MNPVFIKIGPAYYNLQLLVRVDIVNANSFNLIFLVGPTVNVTRAVVDELRAFITIP